MRFIFYSVASVFLFPALAVANPQCATSAPIAFPTGSLPVSVKGPPAHSVPADSPAWFINVPFVKHIASAGAEITDLGVVDGMHQIAANRRDLAGIRIENTAEKRGWFVPVLTTPWKNRDAPIGAASRFFELDPN